jgi:hypothetical protein
MKIRANRAQGGGLKAQHLCGIELMRDMFDSILEGGSVSLVK